MCRTMHSSVSINFRGVYAFRRCGVEVTACVSPRWKAGAGGGGAARVQLGSSAALCVQAQLQDKKRAFSLYVEFLRAARLWQRLGRLTDGRYRVPGREPRR